MLDDQHRLSYSKESKGDYNYVRLAGRELIPYRKEGTLGYLWTPLRDAMESTIPDAVMIGWINGRSGGRSNTLAGDLAWKADTTKGLRPGTSHSALTADASNSRNEKWLSWN